MPKGDKNSKWWPQWLLLKTKALRRVGRQGCLEIGGRGESHSPLTRRSVQISVLRRAVNTRRRIKLTWSAGRGQREEGVRAQGTAPDPAPCPRLPALPALSHCGPGQRGAARSALPGAAGGGGGAARGWMSRDAAPQTVGTWRGAPKLELPKWRRGQTHPSLANSQTTRSHSFPPIRDTLLATLCPALRGSGDSVLDSGAPGAL